MALSAGTVLGPYEIASLLGAGGMGEVYRARDTRLDRFVAIKVLPQHLSSQPDRRERFEREARTVSTLNHPNICTLYDVGRQDGIDYLVMEYLEGETLAQRLQKGPLPVDQLLKHGIEIADALDCAHRQGVVHRDLKPGNIMLTASGAKLLDFGLAKFRQTESAQTNLSGLRTGAAELTGQGMILGTLQYMAPEQLEGQDADPRTDIFAFGATLYEAATGRKAFEGRSQATLIASILSSEPRSIVELQPLAPRLLERIVRKCLVKDPRRRWQSAGDLTDELRWIETTTPDSTTDSVAIPSPQAGRRAMWIAAGTAIIAILATALAFRFFGPASQPSQRPARFTIVPPADAPAFFLSTTNSPVMISISPDGSRFIYIARRGGASQLYLRNLHQFEPTPLTGTEGASDPVFSPDGEWVAFFKQGKVLKTSLAGGTPLRICDCGVPTSFGLDWSLNDSIVVGTGKGLIRVPASGGPPEVIVALEKDEASLRWPQILPGGESVLYTSLFRGAMRIKMSSVGGNERRVLIESGRSARYLAGRLFYATDQGALLAAPFDPAAKGPPGTPVPLLDNVAGFGVAGAAQFRISDDGTLLYLPGVASQATQLAWVDRKGLPQALNIQPPHVFDQERLSPDGKRIVVANREGNGDIWIYEIERKTLTRFTFNPDEDETPLWTPDGKRIIYKRGATGREIFWKAADGSGAEEKLAEANNPHVVSISPDSRFVALNSVEESEDIVILSLEDKSVKPFLKTPFSERGPMFSPDGHWIAYTSNESGRDEIYVMAFPGPGSKYQVSTEGGTEVVWARNGRELFYRNGTKMMAVPVQLGSNFVAGTPQMLFDHAFGLGHRDHPNYDVAPDGQHFLMVLDQTPIGAQINVVLNWLTEVNARMPAASR